MDENKVVEVSKPGVKTTEFWLTLLAQVVAIVGMIAGAVQNEKWIAIVGIAASVLGKLGYDASRAKVKTLGM